MTSETAAVVTFVIALAGLLLSLANTMWAVFAWRRSGPVVRVSGYRSVLVPSDRPQLTLSARNIGREPVQVTMIAWTATPPPGRMRRLWYRLSPSESTSSKGSWIVPTPEHTTAGYPRVLEPGHSESWVIPREDITDHVPDAKQFYPLVTLGTGRTVYGGVVKLDEDD